MSNKTRVIFRFWEGDVIALFPEVPSDYEGTYCDSFQHFGQHSGAEPLMIIRQSRPATPEEYAPLVEELTRAPYKYDLQIIERLPHNARKVREQTIAGMR